MKQAELQRTSARSVVVVCLRPGVVLIIDGGERPVRHLNDANLVVYHLPASCLHKLFTGLIAAATQSLIENTY